MVISKKENVMMKYAYNREKIIIIPESGQTSSYTLQQTVPQFDQTEPQDCQYELNSVQEMVILFSHPPMYRHFFVH